MTIVDARDVYTGLRDRARAAHPDQADYIDRLWAAWDKELTRYGDLAVPANNRGAELLTRAVRVPLDDDALFRLLDVYPSGIIDRMPGGMFA